MKKSILAVLLVLVSLTILFVSCNTDAEHGLYYQLASSSKASSVSMQDFLFEDGTNYIYLNDKGIWKFDGTNHISLFSNTETFKASAAYAKSLSEIYFLDRDGILYKTDGTSDPIEQDKGTTYKGLFSNGYLISSTEIKNLGTDTSISKTGLTGKVLISGSYIACADISSIHIYEASTTTEIAAIDDLTYSGFLFYEGKCYFTQDKTLYQVDGSDVTRVKEFTSAVTPAFGSDGKLYLKTANDFRILNLSNTADVQTITGTKTWANNIATAEKIVFATDKLVATSSSGLYKIDLTANTNEQLF